METFSSPQTSPYFALNSKKRNFIVKKTCITPLDYDKY
ncbi:Uncharacterized protein dnm_067260 [Desulfonema magnum]|uniref:Uncharacterized protein n=1 Tax=Desulfonema magnum TaxID=45655 RepID=A0A975BRS2_9BACT|nr:Uncharacterized protein dnm_067260 [Desulfonema magnum]